MLTGLSKVCRGVLATPSSNGAVHRGLLSSGYLPRQAELAASRVVERSLLLPLSQPLHRAEPADQPSCEGTSCISLCCWWCLHGVQHRTFFPQCGGKVRKFLLWCLSPKRNEFIGWASQKSQFARGRTVPVHP